jgi:Holliday junction resolvasome RuvABC endonuclease subunit
MDEESTLLAIGYQELSGSICDKLTELADWLESLVSYTAPAIVGDTQVYAAIEYPRGWDMRVMFMLGRVNGVVHYIFRNGHDFDRVKDFAEYGPEKGKMALSGKGNANKAMQVESFVEKYPTWETKRVLFKPNVKLDGVITDDEADACGIALAAIQMRDSVYVSSLGTKGVMKIG